MLCRRTNQPLPALYLAIDGLTYLVDGGILITSGRYLN
jgi:hypothetical protein